MSHAGRGKREGGQREAKIEKEETKERGRKTE